MCPPLYHDLCGDAYMLLVGLFATLQKAGERGARNQMTNMQQALIVVDVQAGFLSSYTSRCLPRVYELLASDDFDLIIATRFFNPEGSAFRTRINWDQLSSPEEIRLDPHVEKQADIIVDKSTYGAGDTLITLLNERGINHATLVGIDTDVCVLQNAAYLFDHGINVEVDLAGCATNGGAEADAAAALLMARTIGDKYTLGQAAR